MSAPRAERLRWKTDEGGTVVVRPRGALFHDVMYVLIVFPTVLLVGFGIADRDEGFWAAGFLGFTVPLCVLFLVAGPTDDTLVIEGGAVWHRRRRLLGSTRDAPVSTFVILFVPRDVESSEHWEFGVECADRSPERALWIGELPELVRLGTELHERTGLPFDPQPRQPHQRRPRRRSDR